MERSAWSFNHNHKREGDDLYDETWTPMGTPRARMMWHPIVQIDGAYLEAQVKRLGAETVDARFFMASHMRVLEVCNEDGALLRNLKRLQGLYDKTIAETIPHLTDVGCVECFVVAVAYFVIFNHLRRNVHLWNVAISRHFPPFLLLALSSAAPDSAASPNPSVAFSTLSLHVHSMHVALNDLDMAITRASRFPY